MTESSPGSARAEDDAPFPIVGVGASAGGLEAATELLEHLALDGVAVVFVQHRLPDASSALVEILTRSTSMNVVPVADGEVVQKNHLYVAPAGSQLALHQGRFHVIASPTRLPIDFFFRSLAENHGAMSVGIVLSGMGADGTAGLRAIKERGGICLAQDPSTAKFDSMPRSALEAGVVDAALAPGALGAELTVMGRHPFFADRRSSGLRPAGLDELFALLRQTFHHDLGEYKPATIQRRIERRMAVQKIERLDDYVGMVRSRADELERLYRDLLINVTCFFRDTLAFEALARHLATRLQERRPPRDPFRVWVPACASGEEAFSIAICLLESLGPGASDVPLQIFGTDVDSETVSAARQGIYPATIEQDVTAERLERFFEKSESGYRIGRRVRDLVVFSIQDVAKDAPLSRMDLVSCRNMLIYMQPPLQQRILSTLHYALKPEGLLLLGGSETVGDSSDLFGVVDAKAKLYVKKATAAAHRGLTVTAATPMARAPVERRPLVTAQQLADRRILDQYAPACLLANDDLDVLLFRGDTGPFVLPASGPATLDLMHLVRPELHVELWHALERARKERTVARQPPVTLETRHGDHAITRSVAIEVVPIVMPDGQGTCWLIVFRETTPVTVAVEPRGDTRPVPVEDRARALEDELSATREFLQTTIEDLESTNEELTSTNEELQSANEELQSTNEELETSKEELQSSNEELSTVNEELRHRFGDLTRSDADRQNLLRTIRDPLVFLDADGGIRSFSESAAALLGLGPADVGRRVSHLRAMLGGVDVERLVAEAIERIEPTGEDILAHDGRWYRLGARPFAGGRGTIDGAILTLIDVDAARRSSQTSIDVSAYADRLLPAIPYPLVIVDYQQRVVWANAAFFNVFRVRLDDTVGNLFHNLGSGQWAHPRLRRLIDEVLEKGKPFTDFAIVHKFESIGTRTMRVGGSPVVGLGGQAKAALLAIVDTTAVPGGEGPSGGANADTSASRP